MGAWLAGRAKARTVPLVVTVWFVAAGCLFFFRWAPVVRHQPAQWISPDDVWTTFAAATAFVHGHLSQVYGQGFISLPGFLLLLSPLAALSWSSALVQVSNFGGSLVATPPPLSFPGGGIVHTERTFPMGPEGYAVAHPQAWIVLAPYMMVIACVALFALDACAERLGVDKRRRGLLVVLEAVLLWNVTVIWGHPEDPFAVALALYGLLALMDGKLWRAGWLVGVAIAVQPMVLVLVPLVLFVTGKRWWWLVGPMAAPTVAVTLPVLVGDPSATWHNVVTQPTYPATNHTTPLFSFAPKLGGRGAGATVGGGRLRTIALAAAVAVGSLARKWKADVWRLAWLAAICLGLRCYVESVATPYYVWPALALGVAVAASGSLWLFTGAAAFSILTTVFAQWHLSSGLWYALDIAGLTLTLACAWPGWRTVRLPALLGVAEKPPAIPEL